MVISRSNYATELLKFIYSNNRWEARLLVQIITENLIGITYTRLGFWQRTVADEVWRGEGNSPTPPNDVPCLAQNSHEVFWRVLTVSGLH